MAGEKVPSPNPIAVLNDAFRKSGRGIFITDGVQILPDLIGLVRAVQAFDKFTPDNDPRGEHDFGSIVWHEEKTYWKIDYFDAEYTYWCDPLSDECHRVLTILLASEY